MLFIWFCWQYRKWNLIGNKYLWYWNIAANNEIGWNIIGNKDKFYERFIE